MKLSSSAALIISILLAIMVVFVIDPLDPSTLSTPFCLGLILMGLSFRQKGWVVVIVSMIYCVLVIYAMIYFIENQPLQTSQPHPWFWFFQRFGTFLLLCIMAIYLSYYREDTQQNLTHIQGILSKLPAPVVISDAAGYITYVNETLCTFLDQPAARLLGKRYVDLFMSQTQEGKAMRYYIELFSDQSNSVHEVELRTSVGSSNTIGFLTCMGLGASRSMITVLQSD